MKTIFTIAALTLASSWGQGQVGQVQPVGTPGSTGFPAPVRPGQILSSPVVPVTSGPALRTGPGAVGAGKVRTPILNGNLIGRSFPLVPPVTQRGPFRTIDQVGSFPAPGAIVQPVTNYPPDHVSRPAPINLEQTPVNPANIRVGATPVTVPAAPVRVGTPAVTQSGSAAAASAAAQTVRPVAAPQPGAPTAGATTVQPARNPGARIPNVPKP